MHLAEQFQLVRADGRHAAAAPQQAGEGGGERRERPEVALLGLVVVGVMFFTPAKINRYLPTPLLALLIGSLLAALLSLDVDHLIQKHTARSMIR